MTLDRALPNRLQDADPAAVGDVKQQWPHLAHLAQRVPLLVFDHHGRVEQLWPGIGRRIDRDHQGISVEAVSGQQQDL